MSPFLHMPGWPRNLDHCWSCVDHFLGPSALIPAEFPLIGMGTVQHGRSPAFFEQGQRLQDLSDCAGSHIFPAVEQGKQRLCSQELMYCQAQSQLSVRTWAIEASAFQEGSRGSRLSCPKRTMNINEGIPSSWRLTEGTHQVLSQRGDEELTLGQVPQNEHTVLTGKGQVGGGAADLRHCNGRCTGPHVLTV